MYEKLDGQDVYHFLYVWKSKALEECCKSQIWCEIIWETGDHLLVETGGVIEAHSLIWIEALLAISSTNDHIKFCVAQMFEENNVICINLMDVCNSFQP